MGILKKIFKKNVPNQPVAVYEDVRPERIIYRTKRGGAVPLDYAKQDSEIRLIEEEAMQSFDQLFSAGAIDEYTEPELLFGLLEHHFKKITNEIDLQTIERIRVSKSIKMLAETDKLLYQREITKYREEEQRLLGLEEKKYRGEEMAEELEA